MSLGFSIAFVIFLDFSINGQSLYVLFPHYFILSFTQYTYSINSLCFEWMWSKSFLLFDMEF